VAFNRAMGGSIENEQRLGGDKGLFSLQVGRTNCLRMHRSIGDGVEHWVFLALPAMTVPSPAAMTGSNPA